MIIWKFASPYIAIATVSECAVLVYVYVCVSQSFRAFGRDSTVRQTSTPINDPLTMTMGRRTKETILKFWHHFIWLQYSMSMRTNSYKSKINTVIDYYPVFYSNFSFRHFFTSNPSNNSVTDANVRCFYLTTLALDLWFYWRFIVV